MASNQSLTEAADLSAEQPITIQPSGMGTYVGPADWVPGGETPAASAGSPTAFLHALRRNWLIIVAMGIACSAVAGTVTWILLQPKYEAKATLLMAPANPRILADKPTADDAQVTNEFDIFRQTQRSLIKQRFVLSAALRDPKLKNLASVQREDKRHNALAWLAEQIRVDLLPNSGVMEVSATSNDGAEAAAIVNAVIEAYREQVLNSDRQKRRERLNELQHISAQKEGEVRTKREELKRELEQIGVPDDQTVAHKIQMAVNIYAEFQRELQRMKAEQKSLIGRLKEIKDVLATLPNAEIPETEVAMILNGNPIYRELLTRRQGLEGYRKAQEATVIPGPKQSPGTSRVKAELDGTDAQIERLEQLARDQVRGAKRIELEREKTRYESRIAVATEQLTAFEKEVQRKGTEVESVGKSTVIAQMARADVDNLERILRSVSEERERLRVELDAAPRVSILGDKNAPAAVPETETGTTLRYAMILFSSIAALFLPAIAVILWDLRKGRVNSAADVSKRLKIPVTGTLPMIPAMVMRRLGTPTRRSQIWRMRYTEAIDGVAARLIRNAENDQSRVTLVTSALSGEGKTWLATQLALSLANARRRTLLVDFDLRQPALDEALGLPLSPGVCEALRGQGDVAQMVQTTETENLFVLTAGSWNRRVLAALSDGSVVTLLEQLRADFEFVIIDSSPLLPVVDARLVCQHVDAVILSVLRDVSQSAKVVAAQEMLDAFGVRNLTAVVTGGEQYGSAKAMLQQAALAEEEQFQANEPLTPAEATQQGSSDARHTLLAEEAPPRTEAGEDDAAGHKN